MLGVDLAIAVPHDVDMASKTRRCARYGKHLRRLPSIRSDFPSALYQFFHIALSRLWPTIQNPSSPDKIARSDAPKATHPASPPHSWRNRMAAGRHSEGVLSCVETYLNRVWNFELVPLWVVLHGRSSWDPEEVIYPPRRGNCRSNKMLVTRAHIKHSAAARHVEPSVEYLSSMIHSC